MSKMKKLVLGLSIAVTMIIALVIGVGGGGSVKASTPNSATDKVVYKKPTEFTFNMQDVSIQKGGSSIEYNYRPNTNAMSTGAVAYEYVFENTMDKVSAVNIKSIDTTDVEVSYAWQYNEKIDTTGTITTYAKFSCQQMQPQGSENSRVYIYIFVTPTNGSIPTTFTSNIVWWYGVPTRLTISNNVTDQTTSEMVVFGQEIDKNTLSAPESFTRIEKVPVYDSENVSWRTEERDIEITYYFDSWFLDENFTQMIDTDNVKPGQQVYARYHNIPLGRTDIMTYNDGSYSLSQCYQIDQTYLFSLNIVVPMMYDDGVNGEACVTSIGYNAFSNDIGMPIKSVSLPRTITNIGESAFKYCNSLTSINLPSGLTSIESYAFSYCTELPSITLPSGLATIKDYAFQNCSKLTSITLPSSLTTIGNYTFDYCEALTSVDFSKCTGLKEILYRAFSNTGLTSINLNNCTDLTKIGYSAFEYCYDLTSIDLSKCTKLKSLGSYLFRHCDTLTNVTLPSSITSIETYAFQYCMQLTYITLPSSVTKIGNLAFNNCNKLCSINLNECNSLTSIGNQAFSYCGALTSINLPSSLTTLGNQAFYNSGLTSVDLSGCTSLTAIANNSFESCTRLTSVKVPTSLTSIGSDAFLSCISLTNIDLSNCTKLTTINSGALRACYSLTSITIPASVTTIGNTAFAYSYNLIEIYNLSSLNIVAGTGYVNGSSQNTSLGEFAKVVHTSTSTPSRIQTIGNMQYYVYEDDFIAMAPTSRNITSVTLDSRTTEIARHAFYKCTGLTSIVIPASVRKIVRDAFSNCSGLTSLTFEQSGKWGYSDSATNNIVNYTYTITAGVDYTAPFVKNSTVSKYWYKQPS